MKRGQRVLGKGAMEQIGVGWRTQADACKREHNTIATQAKSNPASGGVWGTTDGQGGQERAPRPLASESTKTIAT